MNSEEMASKLLAGVPSVFWHNIPESHLLVARELPGFRVPKSWKVVFLPVPISMPALADVEAHPSKLVFRATSCARVVAVERISSSNIADFMNVCFIISLLLYLVSFILNLSLIHI